MTTDEIRDWLAADEGWLAPGSPFIDADGAPYIFPEWYHSSKTVLIGEHPHPPTLDGAAKALPGGWWWERSRNDGEPEWSWGDKEWRAFHPRASWVGVPDTDDEVHDRYNLAYEARKAQKEATNGTR